MSAPYHSLDDDEDNSSTKPGLASGLGLGSGSTTVSPVVIVPSPQHTRTSSRASPIAHGHTIGTPSGRKFMPSLTHQASRRTLRHISGYEESFDEDTIPSPDDGADSDDDEYEDGGAARAARAAARDERTISITPETPDGEHAYNHHSSRADIGLTLLHSSKTNGNGDTYSSFEDRPASPSRIGSGGGGDDNDHSSRTPHRRRSSVGANGDSFMSSDHEAWHSVASLSKRFKWRTFAKRVPYYVPFLSWMPKYERSNLLGDLIAGLTVGSMLVPQGITYANIANLPPIYGLYTSFFPLIIYALMGSSRHLSVGPEITSSILIGKTIMNFPNIPEGDINDPAVASALISAAMAISFVVGLLALLLGLVRLGFLDSILSKPMLAGFVLAVAFTLISEQLTTLLGLNRGCGEDCKPGTLPFTLLIYALKHLDHTNWLTLCISICCITWMFLFQWVKGRYPSNRVLMCIPDILVVVVFSTLASYLLDFNSHGVTTLGVIKSGFVTPAMPNLDQGEPSALITGAITITILGFVETQLVSKKYASKHQYTISANRELIALGCCSFFGSFFGSYCSFGSMTRTKAAESASVKTQAANFFAACVSFCVILWLLPLFQYMPKCTTASIIFVVAVSLIELDELKFIIQVRNWVDLAMFVSMVLMTYFLGVDVGIFYAFGACLLLAVKQTTLPGVTMLGRGFANEGFHDLADMDEQTKNIEGILIYKIEGALYFANAEKMRDSIKRAETQGGFHVHPSEDPHPMSITAVVLDLSTLTSVDSSALIILHEIVTAYRDKNARVCFVKLRRTLRPALEYSGIIEIIGRENLYRTLEDAVNDIQQQNLSNLAVIHPTDSAINVVTRTPDSVSRATSDESMDSNAKLNQPSATMPIAMPMPMPLLSSTSSARRKHSGFFPSITGESPLLRGLTKMKM